MTFAGFKQVWWKWALGGFWVVVSLLPWWRQQWQWSRAGSAGWTRGVGESTGNVWQVTTFGSLAILVVILASVLIPDRSVEPGGVHRRRIVAAVLLSWIAVLLLSRMLWLIVPSSETGIGTMIWVESTRPPWAREIGEMVRDRMYLRSGSDGNGSTLTAIMWSVPVLALLQACSLTAWLARDSRRRAEASL